MENNKAQHTTRGIKHWGLSGYVNFLPRIKVCVTGQDSSPQSATILILTVASNVRLLRTFKIMQNKRLIIIVLTSVILLLIPLIAMQFTDEVNWTLFDFVVAGALLLGTGLMCELVIRKINNIKYRIAICVALLVVLLLIWAELAVGLFGTPFSGQ